MGGEVTEFPLAESPDAYTCVWPLLNAFERGMAVVVVAENVGPWHALIGWYGQQAGFGGYGPSQYHLSPLGAALLQEGVDLAALFNSLSVLCMKVL